MLYRPILTSRPRTCCEGQLRVELRQSMPDTGKTNFRASSQAPAWEFSTESSSFPTRKARALLTGFPSRSLGTSVSLNGSDRLREKMLFGISVINHHAHAVDMLNQIGITELYVLRQIHRVRQKQIINLVFYLH